MEKEVRKYYRFDRITDYMLHDLCPGRMSESRYIRNLILEDEMHFIGTNVSHVNNIRVQLAGIFNNVNQALFVITNGKRNTDILSKEIGAARDIRKGNGLLFLYLNGRGDCGEHPIGKQYRFDNKTAEAVKKNFLKLKEADSKITESRYVRELIRREYTDRAGIHPYVISEISESLTLLGRDINALTKQFNSEDFSYPEVARFRSLVEKLVPLKEKFDPEIEKLLFDVKNHPVMYESVADYIKVTGMVRGKYTGGLRG